MHVVPTSEGSTNQLSLQDEDLLVLKGGCGVNMGIIWCYHRGRHEDYERDSYWIPFSHFHEATETARVCVCVCVC